MRCCGVAVSAPQYSSVRLQVERMAASSTFTLRTKSSSASLSPSVGNARRSRMATGAVVWLMPSVSIAIYREMPSRQDIILRKSEGYSKSVDRVPPGRKRYRTLTVSAFYVANFGIVLSFIPYLITDFPRC